MSLYQTVKSAITVRQVGEMYGMEPDRHGMVCCPFHSDNHPSMMLNESYYYCFACGANGDAIDLTAKLFDLNPRQAAEKLINDFAFAKQCSPQWGLQVTERSCVSKMEGPRPDKLGLDPDKPPANAIALPPNSKTSNRCMHYTLKSLQQRLQSSIKYTSLKPLLYHLSIRIFAISYHAPYYPRLYGHFQFY